MSKQFRTKVRLFAKELLIFAGLLGVVFAFDVMPHFLFGITDLSGNSATSLIHSIIFISVLIIAISAIISFIFRRRFQQSFWRVNLPRNGHNTADILFIALAVLLLGSLYVAVGIATGQFKITGWLWEGMAFSAYLLILFNQFYKYLILGFLEEIIFRGYFQNSLTRIFDNNLTAIILASAVFSAVHIPRTIAGGETSLIAILLIFAAIFATGLLLGYAYYGTGSLVMPTVFHFLINFTNFLALTLPSNEDATTTIIIGPELQFDSTRTPSLWISNMLFLFLLFLIMRRYFKMRNSQERVRT